MSELSINKKQENNVLTVFAEGRIDTATAPQFETDVKTSLDGITKLVIDFEKVAYISSAGLRVLLSFHKAMVNKGGSLVVSKPTEMVYEVFDVTGFADMLNIEK